MGEGKEFDNIWEDFYSAGQHLNKYPFNYVPNFFFRHRPKHIAAKDVTVMEVGFGAANNLWMCAREGYNVCGVDAAKSGVKFANDRFAAEGLNGDLRVGDFTKLPFDENSVHMAINRQALTQVGFSASKTAVAEIHRVLVKDGIFWSNMFSDKSYHNGRELGDGLWDDITEGNLKGVGQTAFHNRKDIEDMYGEGWEIINISHQEHEELLPLIDGKPRGKHCEWFVLAKKI